MGEGQAAGLAVGVPGHQRELPRPAEHHLGAAHGRPARFGQPGPAVRADPDDRDVGGHRHRTLPSSRSTAISSTTRSGCGCGTR